MKNLLFVLESFRRHMDNGRILFQRGMEHAGYSSVGAQCPPPEIDSTNVQWAVDRFKPEAVIMWPRYEWDNREWRGPEVKPEHRFVNWECLLNRPHIRRVVVWHDSGSAREQQKRWHEAYKPDIYLSWYHEDSVMGFAPYVRCEQIVRTYHIIDGDNVPEFGDRSGVATVSGAHTRDVYPLRTNCVQWAAGGRLGDGVNVAPHPGYTQAGTRSYDYIKMLSNYRVAVCTASSYKFLLRKHIEATAAGCIVITDLPAYDHAPGIDSNFIRVKPSISADEMKDTIQAAAANWNFDKQKHYSQMAAITYDYRAECRRLAHALKYHKE